MSSEVITKIRDDVWMHNKSGKLFRFEHKRLKAFQYINKLTWLADCGCHIDTKSYSGISKIKTKKFNFPEDFTYIGSFS